MVTICQEMNWTYYEYMSQPVWFLDMLCDKLSMDNERSRKESEKIRRKYNQKR